MHKIFNDKIMKNTVQKHQQWTSHSKLQLNEHKTEALLIDPSVFQSHPESLMTHIGQHYIMFSEFARNLVVMFDKTIAMKVQADRVCQGAYFEVRRVGSVRQYLSTDATKTIVMSLVLSRLDYCNYLLADRHGGLVAKAESYLRL